MDKDGADKTAARLQHVTNASQNSSPSVDTPRTKPSTGSIAESEPIHSASSEDPGPSISNEPAPRRELTEDDLPQILSQRRSRESGQENGNGEDWAQIEQHMSRMFGRDRQANSEEEKTRHLGVVWKNLTVKGLGLGTALQPTNADIFLALPRLIKGILTRWRKKAPIKTILDDFTVRFYFEGFQYRFITNITITQGCVRPGEMLLVLGRPGSGCSTFLKTIGNQRAGYKSVEGDVRYGGTDAKTMAHKYRSEGMRLFQFYDPKSKISHHHSLIQPRG